MSLAELLLAEFDPEIAATRAVIERVPEERFGWRPHPRSRTVHELAAHLSQLPMWIDRALSQDEFDVAPGRRPPESTPPGSRAELLAAFERHTSEARAAIAGATDEHLQQPWTLRFNEAPVFTLTRWMVIQRMGLNHLVHHRAQLGVCLRLLDLPVPGPYGPSADERVPA